MIHELVGIKDHRVKLACDKDEIVINPEDDEFFRNNMYENYGEIGNNLNTIVEEFKTKNKSQAKVESIEDMQRLMENYPEFKQAQGNMNKHLNIMSEVKRLNNQYHLFEVSEVEQEISSKDAFKEHTKMVSEIFENPDIDGLAKIKILTIYALRYEGEAKLGKFHDILKKQGISDDHFEFCELILKYAGKDRRGPMLFKKNKDILSKGINFLKSNFADVQNVFTQHKSLLHTIIELMLQNKLNERDFPYMSGNTPDLPDNIIVFMIGGATFEEAREISEFNKTSQCNIILGGSTIHNSKTFIAEASDLKSLD